MKGTLKKPCDLQCLVRGSVEISGNINEGSEGFFFFYIYNQSNRATLENKTVKHISCDNKKLVLYLYFPKKIQKKRFLLFVSQCLLQ